MNKIKEDMIKNMIPQEELYTECGLCKYNNTNTKVKAEIIHIEEELTFTSVIYKLLALYSCHECNHSGDRTFIIEEKDGIFNYLG